MADVGLNPSHEFRGLREEIVIVNKKMIYVKWALKDVIARYPLFFYPWMRLLHWRSAGELKTEGLTISQLVTKDTQLVIEGFPRSANTFAVRAFQSAQPVKLRMAYHFHAPAQILQASRLGIPTLVVIRDPKDAVASFVGRWSEVSVTQALELYISFYKSIYLCRSSYVLGEFEEVTQHFSKTVQRINRRFGQEFRLPCDSPSDREKILKRIVKDKSSFSEELGQCKKERILKEILHEKQQKLLTEAEVVYREFIETERDSVKEEP